MTAFHSTPVSNVDFKDLELSAVLRFIYLSLKIHMARICRLSLHHLFSLYVFFGLRIYLPRSYLFLTCSVNYFCRQNLGLLCRNVEDLQHDFVYEWRWILSSRPDSWCVESVVVFIYSCRCSSASPSWAWEPDKPPRWHLTLAKPNLPCCRSSDWLIRQAGIRACRDRNPINVWPRR